MLWYLSRVWLASFPSRLVESSFQMYVVLTISMVRTQVSRLARPLHRRQNKRHRRRPARHCDNACSKQLVLYPSGVKFIFSKMSDDGSTAVEKKGRGRPKANGTQAEAKADTKKRGRPPAATKAKESTKSSDDEQAPVAKRGRGRPKGSKKRAAAPKAKGGSGEGRGRGRPRKDAPPPRKDAASTEEEQDDEDEDEGSDQ